MTKDISLFLRRFAFPEDSGVVDKARAFLRREDGATMVEYGLMVALIAIVCIGAVTTIGTDLNVVFSDIASNL